MAQEATNDRVRVGIIGVSGYSGMELARLLCRHPRFRLTFVSTDRWTGKKLGEKIPISGEAAELPCLSQEDGRGRFGTVDLVFLATPAEVSVELAPRAVTAGARVVDLSGAFRLAAADYPKWYGFEHGQQRLLAEAVYSMPEVTGTERLRKAILVSNPGCYPTAAVFAALPLVRAGLVDPGSLIIDAKSGTTGAGRKATEQMSFSEVADDLRAYRLLRHQHQPEIERVLGLGGASGAKVTFVPHLLPVRRGILATVYGRLRPQGDISGDLAGAVDRALATFAEGRPFIRVVSPEEVTLHASVGTNRVVLGAQADESRGVVIALASIDNLVKGAAGQAVQNANLMFGLPETTGLVDLPGHLP
jgi:N-acetyl-gamma-glutamyl-phosphate reductase